MNVLTRLRHTLPKPVLFGLYGAVGGLLGALVLGEVLWTLLRPLAAPAVVEPPLRVATSPAVEVYQNGTNHFNLKVARNQWDGPVTVTAFSAPEGITVTPVTVPAGASDVDVEVKAAFDAAVSAGEIALETVGPAGDPPRRAGATLEVNVRGIEPGSPELRLSTSTEVVVDQQGTNTFGVVVARDRFDGPVVVEVKGLREGVTAAPLTIPAGATSGEIRVKATEAAPLGSETLGVVATGPAGLSRTEAPPTAWGRVTLTVRSNVTPPPFLRLGVSPGVVVDQTGKNRFGVRVARDYFTGPVLLRVGTMPAGVTATSPVVPAGSDTAEIEIEAAGDAALGVGTALVLGTGPAGLPGATEPPKASGKVQVTVNAFKPPDLKVDIMFVLDVTMSMGFAIDGIRDGIIDFAHELGRRQLDARVGLTGFRDHFSTDPMPSPHIDEAEAAEGAAVNKFAPRAVRRKPRRGTGGAPFPFSLFGPINPTSGGIDVAPKIMLVDKQVFTKSYRAFANVAGASLVAAGGGDVAESSLDALVLGACQPFRQDAIRVMILITDAEPHLPDRWVNSMDDVRAVLREAKINQLHLVIKPLHEAIFTPLQRVAGGKTFNLEEAARNGGAFAALLPDISRTIARIAVASLPPPPSAPGAPPPPPPAPAATRPPLPPRAESKAPPPLPPKASAAGDLPASAAPAVLKGVQSQVTFAAASADRLLLAIAVWTAAIAAAISLALCAGQHHYLREAWLPAPGALRGALGGLAAGLVGGAASQLLFVAAPGSPGGEVLYRVLGWTLLGSLAGLVLAFFVPNLRSDRGLLGGAVGGSTGALGYLAAVQALHGLPGGEPAGRILGAMILGFFIGLMLALAERMARKAWLDIAYGGSETRSVNLGVEPVSIGSNSKASTIYARGSAPVAYRYWFLDGKVKCQDVGTGGVTELCPGSSQQVGAVMVLVRTAKSPGPARGSAPPPTSMPVPRPPMPAPTGPQSPPGGAAPPPKPATPISPPLKAPADPNACPGCGRPVSGPPGRRYCMFCDLSL